MSSSLAQVAVRDRPGSFFAGAALVFLGVFVAGILAVMGDGPRGSGDADTVIQLVNGAFVGLGAFCMWRGRRAILDVERRALVRGDRVVRDLSGAQAVVVYRSSPDYADYFVVVALDRSNLARIATLVLAGGDENVFFAAAAVPERRAEELGEELSGALGVPLLRGVGDQFDDYA